MSEGAARRILTIDEMLAAKLECDFVECPEWGGDVWIQELTAENRMTMVKSLSDGHGKVDWTKLDLFAPFLLVHGVLDAKGNLYLSNKQAAALQKQSSKVVDRIAKAIAALSGLSRDAQVESVKNS